MIRTIPHGRWLALGAALLVATGAVAPRSGAETGGGPLPADLEAACEAGEPPLVMATHCQPYSGQVTSTDPSILLVAGSGREAQQFNVASMGAIGAVWGLAYARGEHAVYAAAFHKRQLPFGPGGPGAIYRVDMATGDIDHVLTVPDAGPDHHVLGRYSLDLDAAAPAGRTSLGDIELSEDGTRLLVVNLFDRHIYHYRLPDGVLLDRFPHGAHDAEWAADARPFGLGVRDGMVYHGVVHTAEATQRAGELLARVYRSRPDGSEMAIVAELPLFGRRAVLQRVIHVEWHPWKDSWIPPATRGGNMPTGNLFPMPLLSDIDFDGQGRMILAFQDRFAAASTMYARSDGYRDVRHLPAVPQGDILRGSPVGDGWRVTLQDAPYDTRLSGSALGDIMDETALGGVAFEAATNHVAASALGSPDNKFERLLSGGVSRFESDGGRLADAVLACHFQRPLGGPPPLRPLREPPTVLGGQSILGLAAPVGLVGDVESACTARVAPTPTPSSLPTPSVTSTPAQTTPTTPVPTSTPSATATEPPTSTPSPRQIFLPLSVRDAPCVPGQRSADVVLVLDASTSMDEATSAGRSKLAAAQEAADAFVALLGAGDRAAVVAFNADAALLSGLTADRDQLAAAIERIQMAELTRIHRGLEVALDVLASREADAARDPIVVLLTDGRSNPDPVAHALAVADQARAAGVRVFTIGLGTDVETEALRAMASAPEDFRAAPDGEDLRAIYASIARAIPCPESAFWPHGP